MIRILLRRSWLIRAPLWLAVAGSLLWAALHWDWWDWTRGLVIAFVAGVGLVAASTFVSGLAVLTRAGFWVRGAGRWSDVIARDGHELTMRVSDSEGFLHVVSFEGVRDWPATARWLDRFVPADLPRPERAEPDPGFSSRVDAWADRLLTRLSERCGPPEYVRRWVLPSEESRQHSLVVSFAPTPAGSLVELCVTESEEVPEITVDGSFAVHEVGGCEADDYEAPNAIARAAVERTAAVLAALFSDTPRDAVLSWQILDADGEAVQFHRDRLMR